MTKFNYENDEYLKKLDKLPPSYYSKYIKFTKKYLSDKEDRFLDIGCGNGAILSQLVNGGYKNGYGVDISKLFVKDARKKGLKNVFYYDGINFPFKKNYFKLVGSFNVLEHVEDPDLFLSNQVELLKKNGYIIVACPNFLSTLFKNSHRRLRGIRNKFKNIILIVYKLLGLKKGFEKMEPVINKKFEYDDDAIVVTNVIDIRRCLKKNKCTIIYESGFINYDSDLYKLIGKIPILNYMLPSCFVVAKKK